MMRRLLIPSIGTVLLLSIFLPLAFLGRVLLNDTDTGIHIRAGEVILKTFSIPRYDMFSFHSPPLPWTAHEWLSEVIMALVHRVYGLTAIVVFFAVILASTYYVLFKILRTTHRNVMLTTALLALVIASSTLHWLARPHIFSYLFILVYHYVLNAYQYRNKNYLYILPLLMPVWVNLHGGFIVGLLLIGIYLAGNLVRTFFVKSEQAVHLAKTSAIFLTLTSCLLTSLLNPYGYNILLFPLRLVQDKFIMDYIIEFWSPNFHGTLPFRYLFYLTIAIFALSKSKPDIIELALVLFFTHMALYSARYIPLFALVVSPIVLKYLDLLWKEWRSKFVYRLDNISARMINVDALSAGYLWVIGAAVAVCAGVANSNIHFQFDEQSNPLAAVEFLKKEHLQGHMLNNDSFGDYVIYAAWPQYEVFVDGRSDMYGASRMQDYDKVMRPTEQWKEVLDKYQINWVFDGAKSPLSILLLQSQDWHLIYADKVAHVYIRNIPENRQMIQRFPNVKPIPTDNDSRA